MPCTLQKDSHTVYTLCRNSMVASINKKADVDRTVNSNEIFFIQNLISNDHRLQKSTPEDNLLREMKQ